MSTDDPVSDLAEHLRFFRELGVAGVSSDARWRRREEDASDGADRAGAAAGVLLAFP